VLLQTPPSLPLTTHPPLYSLLANRCSLGVQWARAGSSQTEIQLQKPRTQPRLQLRSDRNRQRHGGNVRQVCITGVFATPTSVSFVCHRVWRA
jgi:hypothetical protein